MNQALFSSNMDLWETPQEFFKKLDNEFHFTLDACATPENAKCDKFFTEKDNALVQDWSGNTVFCNPPYSRKGGQDLFVKKAYEESLKPDTVVVMLLPARTDTKRFHKYIYIRKRKYGSSKDGLPLNLVGNPFSQKPGDRVMLRFRQWLSCLESLDLIGWTSC